MPRNLIAVIGDIHGCYHTLNDLYKDIKGFGDVYTVGDLVDRGKYSKDVVQFCYDNMIRSVRGNHEDMLIKAVECSDKFLGFMYKEAELYYHNGGQETQYSYIGSREYSDFKEFKNKLKSTGHLQFLKSLPLKYEFKKLVISHAGIIEGGNDVSILWNRHPPANIEKLQIFGHTPNEEIIYLKNYYSNIDTGCVFGNKLTAVIVDPETGIIDKKVELECDPRDVDEAS